MGFPTANIIVPEDKFVVKRGVYVSRVVTPDGDVAYDPTGKLAGRGAYLCRNEECITAELKKAAKLSKGLKKPLTEEEIKELAKSLLESIKEE